VVSIANDRSDVDLNLLRVFLAIYEERSLAAASRRLSVTPSAVSQALARLRRQLGDRLFTTERRDVLPTRVAEALYPDFRDAVSGIDRALRGTRAFDPARSDRRFRVALSELGEIGYLPPILAAVRAAAPAATVEAVPLDPAGVGDLLATGAVDLAISSSPIRGGFAHTTLKSWRYVVLSARDRTPATLDLDEYLAAEHVVVAGDSGYPRVVAALERLGRTLVPLAVVHHFAAVPHLLAEVGGLATVSDRLAAGWARDGALRVRSLPLEMDPPEVRLYQRPPSPHSAAVDWFARLVHRAVRDAPDAVVTL